MGAGAEDVPAFFAGHDAAHGQTAGDALGKGRHIRQDAVILEGEQLAGAAHIGLHLVHQQQPVPLLTELLHGLYIRRLQRQHAAFALHQLQHDGAHVVSRGGLHGRCIRQTQKYQIRRIQQLFPFGGILPLEFVYEQQVDIAARGKPVIDLETSGAVLAVNVNLRFQ